MAHFWVNTSALQGDVTTWQNISSDMHAQAQQVANLEWAANYMSMLPGSEGAKSAYKSLVTWGAAALTGGGDVATDFAEKLALAIQNYQNSDDKCGGDIRGAAGGLNEPITTVGAGAGGAVGVAIGAATAAATTAAGGSAGSGGGGGGGGGFYSSGVSVGNKVINTIWDTGTKVYQGFGQAAKTGFSIVDGGMKAFDWMTGGPVLKHIPGGNIISAVNPVRMPVNIWNGLKSIF